MIPKQGNEVYQLVEELKRAWHAGRSQWQSVNQLNYSSIGIEIVSLGYQVDKHGKPIRDKHGSHIWYPFEEQQIDLVIALAKDIVQRYNILPTRVVGRSDISPDRKLDPGALFLWKKLHDHGIGAWPNPEDVQAIEQDLSTHMAIASLQENFKKYGYDVAETGILDAQTKSVVNQPFICTL